jgi:hypothetical protein
VKSRWASKLGARDVAKRNDQGETLEAEGLLREFGDALKEARR